MPISRLFADVLDTPLRNVRGSWGAYNPDLNAVVLRIWSDEIVDDEILVMRATDPGARWGHKERGDHLALIRRGARGFAVLCDAADRSHAAIRRYDAQSLLVLGQLYEDHLGNWTAALNGTLPVALFRRELSGADAAGDIVAIETRAGLGPTERENLSRARIGQGRFRAEMLRRWDYRCALSSCAIPEVLRASHAKSWRDSSDAERLDPDNGLLLAATYDALFDCGLIGFDTTGAMQISTRLNSDQRHELGLPSDLRRRPNRACAAYLAHHLATVFQRQ